MLVGFTLEQPGHEFWFPKPLRLPKACLCQELMEFVPSLPDGGRGAWGWGEVRRLSFKTWSRCSLLPGGWLAVPVPLGFKAFLNY